MTAMHRRRRRHDDSVDLESRISSVETAVEHIEHNIVDIRDSLRIGFLDLKKEIDQQQENSRPQIVAWAGWAGVLLLIIGMFGSGYIRDLSRVEKHLVKTEDLMYKHLENSAESHAETEQRLKSLEWHTFPTGVVVNERR